MKIKVKNKEFKRILRANHYIMKDKKSRTIPKFLKEKSIIFNNHIKKKKTLKSRKTGKVWFKEKKKMKISKKYRKMMIKMKKVQLMMNRYKNLFKN